MTPDPDAGRPGHLTADCLSRKFLDKHVDELYRCASCNYCVDAVWAERGVAHVCATLEHHQAAPGYSGRGFIEIARALVEGVELDTDAVAERVFTCTACGNCETLCPLGLHPAGVGQALREVLHANDAAPAPVAVAQQAILRRGHAAEALDLPEPDAATHAPAALTVFAGCSSLGGETSEAAAVRALLVAADIPFAWHDGRQRCCGAALESLGAVAQSHAWQQTTVERLTAASAAQRITLGVECEQQLTIGGSESRSFVSWLLAQLEQQTLRFQPRAGTPAVSKVALFESCRLKPRTGLADPEDEKALRALMEHLGLEVENAGYPNRHTLCCGAGGTLGNLQPEAAARMAEARLAPYAALPVVTVDPRCATHCQAATGIEVLGVARFLVRYFTCQGQQGAWG